jgi:hypothetical protein
MNGNEQIISVCTSRKNEGQMREPIVFVYLGKDNEIAYSVV